MYYEGRKSFLVSALNLLFDCGVVEQGYKKAVITPNAMEFSRLVKSILCKGEEQTI